MHGQLTEWWNSVSLRTKITGVTVMLLTLGLLVAGVGTMSVLRSYLLDEIDTRLNGEIVPLSETIKYDDSTGFVFCEIPNLPSEYSLSVVSEDGTVLCDNKTNQQDRPLLTGLTIGYASSHQGAFTVFNREHTSQWRVTTYLPAGEKYTIVLARNLDETNALIARYVAIFLFFGLAVVVLGGALTRLLVTSTFGPLRAVENTAARFAAGDFSQRLEGGIPNTEVGRLNGSLNAMLSRIDSAFNDRAKTIEQMRRFVGDASHELRTPLVSVRGYAELYRMGAISTPAEVAQAMERIEKEAIRMGELVEDLLELARIDEAKPLNLAPVDLVPLAHDAALDAMASSPDRRVTVVVTDPIRAKAPVSAAATGAVRVQPTASATSPAAADRTNTHATGPIWFASATLARLRTRRPRKTQELAVETLVESATAPGKAIVLGEENKIRQVLTNLMGNAVRFTPRDSPIEIAVTVDEIDDRAIISVIDHGEGIPPQIREKIFQRFWRADTSRTRETGGSGLGLAIVASIVASHKGTVSVVDTPGGGSTFRVNLPLLHEAPEPSVTPSTR